MNKELLNKIAKQAIANIEHKQNDKHDTRWWIPELYDQEFARLVIEEVYTIVDELIYKYKDGGETLDFMSGHYSATLEFRVKLKQLFGVKFHEYK